jgi:carboxypeptidase family protein
VSGAVVTWFGPETGSIQTDVGGNYVAVDLAPGDYFFTAQAGGCTPASAQVTVLVGTTIMQDLIIDCP